MYCIECGQPQALQQARFCPFCGSALHFPEPEPEAAAAPPALPAEPVAADGAVTEPAPPAPAPADAPKALETIGAMTEYLDPARWVPLQGHADTLRRRLRWAIAAALVLAVAAAVGGYLWWVQGEQARTADDGIEVEQIAPAASEPAGSSPRR